MKKVALLTWLPSWRAGTPALSVTPTKPCERFPWLSVRPGKWHCRESAQFSQTFPQQVTPGP